MGHQVISGGRSAAMAPSGSNPPAPARTDGVGSGGGNSGLGFNMNDFPSLGARDQSGGAGPDTYRNAAAGAAGTAEPQSFAMSSADFPALPGSRAPPKGSRGGGAEGGSSSAGRPGGAAST